MKTKHYFNFELDVLGELKQAYKHNWNSYIICINGCRNIGKTTSIWNYLENVAMKPDKKIVYIRLRDAQMVFAVRDLNNRFKNRFYFTKTHIYNCKKVVRKDKDDKDIIIYEKDEVVGFVGTISTYANVKSGEFADVEYVFFDEYNEDTNQLHVYINFINLITTAIRFSLGKIIMLGNRDTANNEFMVKWKIEQRDDTRFDEYQRFSKSGFFVELGDDSYKALGNEKTLFFELAQFDKSAKRYLDGGYINDFSMLVINYDKYIAPSFNPKFALAIKGVVYSFGRFVINGELKYCFVSADDYYNDRLKIYSIDTLSDIRKDSKLIDDLDRKDLLEFIFKKIKQQSMYYNSFDTKNILEESITRYQMLR